MPTVVAKLGSSIVSGDDGALREDVLRTVCGEVADLHAADHRVVIVTSGAIARGMRVLAGAALGGRPPAAGARPTAAPRRKPGSDLIPEVTDFEALEAVEIGHAGSPLGSGGMRSKVVAAEMATAAGIEAVIGTGLR